MQAKGRVAEVIQRNQVAPQMVVDLFAEHLSILDQGVETFVAQIMGRDPAPSLENFEQILRSLDDQADAVRIISSNTVCTGLFRYEL